VLFNNIRLNPLGVLLKSFHLDSPSVLILELSPLPQFYQLRVTIASIYSSLIILRVNFLVNLLSRINNLPGRPFKKYSGSSTKYLGTPSNSAAIPRTSPYLVTYYLIISSGIH
jgi:hypothetical protein